MWITEPDRASDRRSGNDLTRACTAGGLAGPHGLLDIEAEILDLEAAVVLGRFGRGRGFGSCSGRHLFELFVGQFAMRGHGLFPLDMARDNTRSDGLEILEIGQAPSAFCEVHHTRP